MPTPESRLGQATWTQPNPNTIPQVQLGETIWQGTAVHVQSYRNMAGQHITRIRLEDPILIRDGSDQ